MRVALGECPILHVDMDAFYASVALRDRPELRAEPVIVGGSGRSVVLAANYPAREYGIGSGQSMTRARRLCPDAVVMEPDYSMIETVSNSVMEIFREITPQIEAISIDEAFLDVRGSIRRFGPPEQIAHYIRARVYDEQKITCSVGIAGALTVAKIASKKARPDGIVMVRPEEVTSFLHPLAVGELWGVGPKTVERLQRLGLHRVGDIAHTPQETLCRALGAAMGSQVYRLTWGQDGRSVDVSRNLYEPERSIGSQETFARDSDDPTMMARELLRLAGKVGRRMRAAQLVGRTVTITVRFADFTTITRSRSRDEATDVTAEIYDQAMRIYDGLSLQRARVRLLGVRVEGLLPKAQVHRQYQLGQPEMGWEEVDQVMDAVAVKYGRQLVEPATLLG